MTLRGMRTFSKSSPELEVQPVTAEAPSLEDPCVEPTVVSQVSGEFNVSG